MRTTRGTAPPKAYAATPPHHHTEKPLRPREDEAAFHFTTALPDNLGAKVGHLAGQRLARRTQGIPCAIGCHPLG